MSDKQLAIQEIINRCFVNNTHTLRAGINDTQDCFNMAFDESGDYLRISIVGGGGILYWGAPVQTPAFLPVLGKEGEVRFVFDNGFGASSLFYYSSGAWHEFQFGDAHNKGFFASESALRTAYPTANPGDYAIVAKIGDKDSLWLWDVDADDWIDTYSSGMVVSVFGRSGVVHAQAGDYSASQVVNNSTVSGTMVSDALNTLNNNISMLTKSVIVINNGETKDVSIFDVGLYRTVEWLISVTDGTDGTYRSEKIVAHHDGTDVTHTEFAIIGKASIHFDVVKTGSYIRLQGTATKNAQTVKTVNIAVEA